MSIASEMAGVERARARVRELTPLLFNFDLPIVPSFQTAPDTNTVGPTASPSGPSRFDFFKFY